MDGLQLSSLIALGRLLHERRYRFTTITPASHRIVLARHAMKSACSLRQALGWSMPFARGQLDDEVERLLEAANATVELGGGLCQSTLRASTLSTAEGERLFFHSAFPTDDVDAVFFGPDTYRFANLLSRWLPGALGRVVDVGAGSGAGGIVVAARAQEVVLADVNQRALVLSLVNALVNASVNASVNAALAGAGNVFVRESDVLGGLPGEFDVVISNPPYLVDAGARQYRHGGDRGIELAVRIVEESLLRLRPGGRLLVYTGTPVCDGVPLFLERTRAALQRAGAVVRVEELDPDVFGEELASPAYADVERIALVGLLATVP